MKAKSQRPAIQTDTPVPSQSGVIVPRMHLELDESVNEVAVEPNPKIVQAKKDIDAGMVDTDMWATPGLDSARRNALVPGPGGKHLKAKSK